MITEERKAELDAELKALNGQVDEALARRKAWMDVHMGDYARHQIGEELYELDTGRRLGRLVGYYRYNDRQNPLSDSSMHIDYEIEVSPRCFDNTSRRGGAFMVGNREELAKRLEWRRASLLSRTG